MKLRVKICSAVLFFAVVAGIPGFAGAERCLSPAEMMERMNMTPAEGRIIASFPVHGLEKMCGYVVKNTNSHQIFYSNGDYFIFGRLIDFTRGVEVGEAYLKSLQTLRPEQLAELKKLSSWTIGHGAKEVILLTDPECPYCHQLEESIQGLEDEISFYVILYPLSQHPAGQGAARRMICEQRTFSTIAEYAETAQQLTAESTIINEAGCPAYSENRQAVSRFLRENNLQLGFPALVFSNGYHVSGALPREVFLKAVNGNSK